MPMLPSPICPLAGQSIFGQNVVCGSMTHLPSARSTEECHLIRSFFQVLCFDHRLAYTYPPFRTTDNQLLQTTSSLLATDVATLQRTIEELARAGVLLRRGRGVRIAPDVLSDHILHRACITEQGQLTGYAQT